MGNSTISLQNVMDSISSIGDIQTVLDHTGGWADEPALSIGNDALQELISVRFPWKWNRIKIPPFTLNSTQQDYATLGIRNIGWLENCARVDVNNSIFPPPTWPIYVVRDLLMANIQAGFPYQVCWLYNRDLEQGPWPGPVEKYIDPIGNPDPPQNGATNIRDALDNLLVLTKYGVTGLTKPVAPLWKGPGEQPDNWPIGQVVADGTAEWTVADPDAQGFRFHPVPPKGGQVWLIRIYGQKKAPKFYKLSDLCNPIPDDEIKWFKDGCIAYAHRYSANPNVKARFESRYAQWVAAMVQETRQNDREDEARGFFPDKSVMSPSYTTDPGPYPYRFGWHS